jgi:hypothetical protein
MISKMNYLMLSTMMVAAINSTFGCGCPCGKEKVEEGEEDDFETKIISSSYDNDKKDDVKVQRSNDEFTNPVIEQNATDKYTNVKMGSTSGGGNLKNDNQKNDIKPKVEYDEQIKKALAFMRVLQSLCRKDGCQNGKIVHLEVITVNETNAIKETGIDLKLCEKHNRCHFAGTNCKKRPEYILQCGHMFCSSHYHAYVRPTLCKECGLTLCGCMNAEFDHKPCGTSINDLHYLCNRDMQCGRHACYRYGQYCKRHKQIYEPHKERPQRVYIKLVNRKGNHH